MSVKQNDRELFLEHGVHFASRTLTLFDELNSDSARQTIKRLHLLEVEGDSPIIIKLHSPGGEDYAGYAVYDAIRKCRSQVTIEVYGHAMSIAVLVLQAADRRVALQQASFMIHEGSIKLPEVKSSDLVDEAKETIRLNNMYRDILFSRVRERDPKYPLRKFKELLKRNTYFNADEALTIGLVDEVERA